jgi:hypothetical protein
MQSQRGFWDRVGKELNYHACSNSCRMSAVDETERFQTHTCEISRGLQLRVSLIGLFLKAGLIAGAKARQISTSTTGRRERLRCGLNCDNLPTPAAFKRFNRGSKKRRAESCR